MELSEVEVYEGVVPLHPRESVEGRRHPTHTVSSPVDPCLLAPFWPIPCSHQISSKSPGQPWQQHPPTQISESETQNSFRSTAEGGPMQVAE
jgi:hypothetical protein